MKRRIARSRREPTSRRPQPVTVSELIRSTGARLKRAKLVFAHGTIDPVAEAAFMVRRGDRHSPRSCRCPCRHARGLSAAAKDCRAGYAAHPQPQARRLSAQAHLHARHAVYIDERAIVPRSYLGELLDDELFSSDGFSLVRDPGTISRVLDLRTGSGCLAVLAALRFPQAKVDAVELSEDALAVARRNVSDHRLTKRIRLVGGDLFEPLRGKRSRSSLSSTRHMWTTKAWARCRRSAVTSRRSRFHGGRDGFG